MSNDNIIYNKIGYNYNKTRIPDLRIYNEIIKLLECKRKSKIIDVGAGTGNYSFLLAKNNYIVDALEPSELMQESGKKHKNLNWILSVVEKNPCKNNYYDGAVCTLAIHHFMDIEMALKEIYRLLKKDSNFILFTADPKKSDKKCWINYYFKELVEYAMSTLPDIELITEKLENIFNTKAEIKQFLLPCDLTDSFFYSGWKFPEKYLDEKFRNGISVFSMADQELIIQLINKLKKDIDNGKWYKKYSKLKNKDFYNCGYYFIKIIK